MLTFLGLGTRVIPFEAVSVIKLIGTGGQEEVYEGLICGQTVASKALFKKTNLPVVSPKTP